MPRPTTTALSVSPVSPVCDLLHQKNMAGSGPEVPTGAAAFASSPSSTTSVVSPMGSAGATPASAIASVSNDPVKRARRTAIERRSRQQRQARIKLLQDEVSTLSNILEDLKLPKRLHDNARALLDDFGLVPAHTPAPKVLVSKMDAVRKEMRALEREHRQLQRRLYEHQNAAAVMRDLVSQPDPDDWSMSIKRWDAISKQYYKPLTEEQCTTIMDDCMKTITRFSLSDDFVSSGLSLNGWVDRTRYEASTSTLEFSFCKDIPYVDPTKQFDKYWKIFWNEADYRRVMLGLQAKYHMHILQRVSDDIIIFRQDIKYPRIDASCHHISINFRRRTPEGYLLCMRTIPMPEIQQAMNDVIWTDNFHWTHTDEIRDRQGKLTGSRSTACGAISSENAQYATIWIMEAAVTVLRIESALISPLILPE